jgi:hypothetical protein
MKCEAGDWLGTTSLAFREHHCKPASIAVLLHSGKHRCPRPILSKARRIDDSSLLSRWRQLRGRPCSGKHNSSHPPHGCSRRPRNRCVSGLLRPSHHQGNCWHLDGLQHLDSRLSRRVRSEASFRQVRKSSKEESTIPRPCPSRALFMEAITGLSNEPSRLRLCLSPSHLLPSDP